MKTLLNAYQDMASALMPLSGVWRSTPDAVHCVLNKPVYSPSDHPRFSQSAMDGYVVHNDDLGPTQEPLALGGTIQAGDPEPSPVLAGRPQRIFTGGAIPKDGAAVRIQENVERLGSGTVQWQDHLAQDANIRRQGSDIQMGASLLSAGHSLTECDLALLANLQIQQVFVHRLPRIGLMTTGNELVDFNGQEPTFGQVVDGNQVFLSHHLERMSHSLKRFRLTDDRTETARVVFDAIDELDVLVTCGGMSVGDFDVLGQLLRDRGDTLFYKVAVKPGKPILLSRIGETIVVGLPGNPISTLVGYHLFVRPALRLLAGNPNPFPSSKQGILKTELGVGGSRVECLRAHVDRSGAVSVAEHQGSAALSGLINCNALVIRAPESTSKRPGDSVPVHRFNDPENGCSLAEFESQIWPMWS